MAITRPAYKHRPPADDPYWKISVNKGERKRVLLHRFKMGDVDDLEIYVAHPIWEWQQTEQGKWCVKHCEDLRWNWQVDMLSMGYIITIDGILYGEDLTYFLLKWGEVNENRT